LSEHLCLGGQIQLLAANVTTKKAGKVSIKLSVTSKTSANIEDTARLNLECGVLNKIEHMEF
jgi:hypothetical protein